MRQINRSNKRTLQKLVDSR